MKCTRCQQENRPGAKFCEECAAPLARVCSSCGAPLSVTAKFCSECAHPAGREAPAGSPRFGAPEVYTPKHLAERILRSKAALEGERKQVTVLFADLKGSMELLADRDPEEARKLLDPVLERMMEAVHRYEGTVNQVMGDGIMALFGAPLAHEDHAVRACYAALDIHAALARHAETLPAAPDVELRVRIGLNSGEVVVRSIGTDLHMDYTAVGQTTHLAARMEQLARPGTTYLTPATRRLVAGFVEVRSLGLQPIKGLAAPMEVFQLVGVGPTRTRREAARARALTPFVGREAELLALEGAAAAAGLGRGRVVTVEGEPGVGKSRLVSEFTTARLPAGWRVLEAGTTAYGQGSPTAVELMRGYFGLGEDDPPERMREVVTARLEALGEALSPAREALMGLLGAPVDDEAWQRLEPSQRRHETLETVSRLLLGHAAGQPLCLVVEDLHWADSDTLDLLDRLVRRVPEAPVLLVATHRPELRRAWASRDDDVPLTLEPLPRDQAERLLDDLLGAAPDLRPIKRQLIERTEGNPFFLEECVQDLAEKGVLGGRRGAYRAVGPTGAVDVPPTVQSVLAARIDRLPPPSKLVLQTAAVVGKDVPLALLEAALDDGGADLPARLGELEAGEFLYAVAGPPAAAYTFRHVLTRDVAYGSLLADRRRLLDQRIVLTLERMHPEPTADQVERLAYHSARGEMWDRAVRHGREAGARAFARSAHRAAVEHFEQALDALGRLPPTPAAAAQAIDLHLDLRYALMPLGEFRRVFTHLSEAGALARQTDDRRRLGLVSALLTNYHHLMGNMGEAVATGRHALVLAAQTRDLQTEVLANAALGLTYYVLGAYRQAIDVARRNVALLQGPLALERFGSAPLPSVYSRTCLAWSLAEVGEFDAGGAVAREGQAIAEGAGHSVSLVYACLGSGGVALRRGHVETAVPALERALDLCQEADIPLLASLAAPPLTSAYVLAGRAKDALAVLERAGRQAASIDDPVERRTGPGALAEAYLAGGRAAEALPLARRYLEQRRTLGARGFEAWALRLLAEVLLAQDPPDLGPAEDAYGDALGIARELGMRPLEALCRAGLVRVHERGGDRVAAEREAAAADVLLQALGMDLWRSRLPRRSR